MKELLIISFALVCMSLAGIDLLRTREHNRAVELVLLEAQCEERISHARELRVIVDLKLKAIEGDGLRGYWKIAEMLEKKK